MIINAGAPRHCDDGRNTAAQWQPAMWPTFLRLLVGRAAAHVNLKSSGTGPGPIAPPARGYYEIACQCQWVAYVTDHGARQPSCQCC